VALPPGIFKTLPKGFYGNELQPPTGRIGSGGAFGPGGMPGGGVLVVGGSPIMRITLKSSQVISLLSKK